MKKIKSLRLQLNLSTLRPATASELRLVQGGMSRACRSVQEDCPTTNETSWCRVG